MLNFVDLSDDVKNSKESFVVYDILLHDAMKILKRMGLASFKCPSLKFIVHNICWKIVDSLA